MKADICILLLTLTYTCCMDKGAGTMKRKHRNQKVQMVHRPESGEKKRPDMKKESANEWHRLKKEKKTRKQKVNASPTGKRKGRNEIKKRSKIRKTVEMYQIKLKRYRKTSTQRAEIQSDVDGITKAIYNTQTISC